MPTTPTKANDLRSVSKIAVALGGTVVSTPSNMVVIIYY